MRFGFFGSMLSAAVLVAAGRVERDGVGAGHRVVRRLRAQAGEQGGVARHSCASGVTVDDSERVALSKEGEDDRVPHGDGDGRRVAVTRRSKDVRR